jgi:hypothetical protein
VSSTPLGAAAQPPASLSPSERARLVRAGVRVEVIVKADIINDLRMAPDDCTTNDPLALGHFSARAKHLAVAAHILP